MDHVVKVSELTQYVHGQRVLDEISFQVAEGELFILTGPSGAGKTTLVSILAGIQAYKSGNVEVCGHNLSREKERHKQCIGLVTQVYSLFDIFTVMENLTVIGMMRGMPSKKLNHRVGEMIELFQLGDVLNRKAGTLPWGPRQRLALACAMLAGPKLLLVDDILLKGDFRSAKIILENTIRYVNEGNACIWATGRLREAANLAGDRPDLAKLALTSGWDDAALEDVGLTEDGGIKDPDAGLTVGIYCKPSQIGYLDKGRLALYSAGEFARMVQ